MRKKEIGNIINLLLALTQNRSGSFFSLSFTISMGLELILKQIKKETSPILKANKHKLKIDMYFFFLLL